MEIIKLDKIKFVDFNIEKELYKAVLIPRNKVFLDLSIFQKKDNEFIKVKSTSFCEFDNKDDKLLKTTINNFILENTPTELIKEKLENVWIGQIYHNRMNKIVVDIREGKRYISSDVVLFDDGKKKERFYISNEYDFETFKSETGTVTVIKNHKYLVERTLNDIIDKMIISCKENKSFHNDELRYLKNKIENLNDIKFK